MKIYPNFDVAIKDSTNSLLNRGHILQPNNWQSMDVSKLEQAKTQEILNHSLQVPMYSESLHDYQEAIKPNLPWADDHFENERTCGEPLNPGSTWRYWPWGLSADKFRVEGEQFSHSYAERYWPKHAGQTPNGELKGDLYLNQGYRYPYGDLDDVVERLIKDPITRQAVLSVWHPEDQHNGGQRVPCSLFYQFIQRNRYLHVVYTIRSCDALRHFRDDIYLTVRLVLWVLDHLRRADPEIWNSVVPGSFTMHITSFHCFVTDQKKLRESIK